MYDFWLELLLFASKVVIILVVLAVLAVVCGAVIKSVVSAVSAKNKKKDDDIIFTIENYGDRLSEEKETLEKSMLKALDDDTYEVFNKIKEKGDELKEGEDKDANKKLVQQGFEALTSERRNTRLPKPKRRTAPLRPERPIKPKSRLKQKLKTLRKQRRQTVMKPKRK